MATCLGRTLGTLTLGAGLLHPAGLCAQDHVVAPRELAEQLRSAAATRARNVARLQQFLFSDTARASLRSMKVDPVKVQNAVPSLSDQELARLAAQADRLERDFAAGELSHFQITLIIVGAIILGVVIAIAAA